MSEIVRLANDLLAAAANTALSDEERLAAFEAHKEIADDAFAAALGDFGRGTSKILKLSDTLLHATRALGTGSGALDELFDRVSRLQSQIHDPEGMRTTWMSVAEFDEDTTDEADLPPDGQEMGLPAPPVGLTRLTTFHPINSHNFAVLENEYVRFFASQTWKSEDRRNEAHRLARRALDKKSLYDRVVDGTNVPWWFVAAIHMLESSFNFGTHLHNGDSLNGHTFRVPAGRPTVGSPPFDWVESARDALEIKNFHEAENWSLARALHRWEAYNGFGYRFRSVPSPYLWSFTNVYQRGKFVGDGVFDAAKVSKQCGAAALLKALTEINAANTNVSVEVQSEGQNDAIETSALEDATIAEAATDKATTNVDGVISTNTDFQAFFETNLPDVTHFKWHEFLVKGASHKGNGLNTDPPREKWPNVIALARVLQKIREEIGQPIVVTSAFRSKAYNAAIGGATSSQHLEFRAADCVIPNGVSASALHQVVKKLRDEEKLFSGGVGIYQSFVHVDTRGVNKDWAG